MTNDFSKPHYYSPVSETVALGYVRCVGRIDLYGHAEWWSGHGWCSNSCYAKRYSLKYAKAVATRKGGVVCRYHEDGHGNYSLFPI